MMCVSEKIPIPKHDATVRHHTCIVDLDTNLQLLHPGWREGGGNFTSIYK